MTQRTSFEEMTCSVARTLELVGEWWTPLILRDVYVGLTRFDAIQEDLGISRKVLAQRLDRLVERGVLERVAYQEHPPRYDYVPTAMGRDLAPVLLAMLTFGDRWLSDTPPVVARHEDCGKLTTMVPACAECGEPLTVHNVSFEPGPGLDEATGPEADAARARLAAMRRQLSTDAA